jgi:transcriptional regulator with XRE-family HTH domain
MKRPETLGESVRRLRRDAGLSRQQLAAKAGVSAFDLKQVEDDARKPHFATLQKLVRALNSSFERLSAWTAKWPQEALQVVLEGVVLEMVADGEAEVREGPNGLEYRALPPRN